MTAIELNKLTQWDGNVRKTNTDAEIGELAASINAHGLLNPLTVKGPEAKGKFAVVAGQRRLKALLLLVAEGAIPKSHPVECNVLDPDADLTEVSLAENVVRMAMHPADQFDAFRSLADAGAAVADIAARFGVSEATVTKRLKLGRVHPQLLELYRDGEISLEQVQAFTVTDDQERQLRVWAGLQGWRQQPHGIREALSAGDIPATDKRVRFVGLDIYEAAGGEVRRDLFDDRNAGWVKDAALLEKLVAAKLEAVADEVRAEGWKSVEVRDEFGWQEKQGYRQDHGEAVQLPEADAEEWDRINSEYEAMQEKENEGEELSDAEIERCEAIEARLDQLRDRPHFYRDEVKAAALVVVHLGYQGVEIERGLLPLAARVASAGVSAASSPVEKSPFSAAVVMDLKTEKSGAIQAELATNPKVALAALVHALAGRRYVSQCFTGDNALKASVEQQQITKESEAETALGKIGAKWEKKLPKDRAALWSWCLKQKETTLLDLLAYLVARSADGHSKHADDLVAALGVDLRAWVTPDADNYFGRVSKDQIMADMTEWGVDTAPYASMKKAELAKVAAKLVTAEGKDWVPVPMRKAEPKPVQDEAEGLDDEDELDEAA